MRRGHPTLPRGVAVGFSSERELTPAAVRIESHAPLGVGLDGRSLGGTGLKARGLDAADQPLDGEPAPVSHDAVVGEHA